MTIASPPTLQTVRQALLLPPPGRAAHRVMAPRPRVGDRAELPRPCPREGGVLVLLYERDGCVHVLLTRRTETLEVHRGQVSLPGGTREAGDESLADIALRETSEELGIPAPAIELLGPLTPLYIPPSQFCVYPYVGLAQDGLSLRPDSNEVAEVIEVPLPQLLSPSTRHLELHFREGQRFQIPVYQIGQHRVWGATAMILAEFLAMIRVAQAARPPTG